MWVILKRKLGVTLRNSFQSLMLCNFLLKVLFFKSISMMERNGLEEHFSEDKIKGEVWGCEGPRSPRHDGYNF